MATHSVDLLQLINQQESLYEFLSKANALIKVVQGDSFLNETPSTIHHYFWVMEDVIAQAWALNEQSLHTLTAVLPEENL